VVFLHGIGVIGSKQDKAITAPEEAQTEAQENCVEKVASDTEEAKVVL
jgi:hypothetical protein